MANFLTPGSTPKHTVINNNKWISLSAAPAVENLSPVPKTIILQAGGAGSLAFVKISDRSDSVFNDAFQSMAILPGSLYVVECNASENFLVALEGIGPCTLFFMECV